MPHKYNNSRELNLDVILTSNHPFCLKFIAV